LRKRRMHSTAGASEKVVISLVTSSPVQASDLFWVKVEVKGPAVPRRGYASLGIDENAVDVKQHPVAFQDGHGTTVSADRAVPHVDLIEVRCRAPTARPAPKPRLRRGRWR
jgi:hypothetical protein